MKSKKFVNITYFVHGTTKDNEEHKFSGWYDVELSELGIKQSKELKILIKGKEFDVIFCSDLKRAVQSTKLTFGNSVKIIKDQRLRECNFGDLTRADSEEMDKKCYDCIDKPFPNGESLKDVEKRLRDFLDDLLKKYPGKKVAIVAHKFPQLALDVIIKGKSWLQALNEDWRVKNQWKSGWDYRYEK